MNIVALYSGGLDSTALVFHLLKERHDVRCLGVDYGQRHRRELESAARIAADVGLEYRIADLKSVTGLLSTSALTNPAIEVPDGHYTDELMKITVVPNRNMIMLSLAIGWAVSTGSDAVAYGAHAGDHAIYPDCRPEFAAAMDAAAQLCDWHPIKILAPFTGLSKADIARIAMDAGAPVAATWSCYKGGEYHCGTCGTCVERREAFRDAGIPDPTQYLIAEAVPQRS
jgi:7-cyano-7-deazaguanine synthase